MWTPKRLFSAIGCICLLYCLLWTEGPASSANATPKPLQGPVPKRLLVIVPHPDDESLGSVALIQSTLQAGGSVYLVLLTNGDGFHLAASKLTGVAKPGPKEMYRLGLTRQQEEHKALHRLGLHDQAVEFLGYPDGSLKRLWSTAHWDKRSPIQALTGHSTVPYPLSFHQGAPYAGQAVLEDLQRLFATYQPTDVLYPDPHDIHPDHWAANAFTQLVLAEHQQEPPREWTYLVHFPGYPTPRHYSPQQELVPPAPLRQIGMDWRALPITNAQRQQKHQAIKSHVTQINVMKDFLEAFVRKNELIVANHVPVLSTKATGQQPLAWLDPANDQQSKRPKIPATDIRRLTFANRDRGQQTGWQIGLELAGPVQPQTEFVFTLRQPDSSHRHLTELVLQIQNGQVRWHATPQLSQAVSDALQKGLLLQTAAKNRLFITVPNHVFPARTDLLLHAEIKQLGKTVDQTVWQRLQFAEETRSER